MAGRSATGWRLPNKMMLRHEVIIHQAVQRDSVQPEGCIIVDLDN